MQIIAFVFGILAVFVILPLAYQQIKWHDKDPKRWERFKFDNHVNPEDLRFSALSSNLIIGKREMPHPVYEKLSHLNSSFQEWVARIPVDKDARETYHGRVDVVNVPSDRRRITSTALTTLKLAGLLSLPVCSAFGITFSTHKALFFILLFTVVGSACLHTFYFNAWSASGDRLLVGRWFFRLSIPWSAINSLEMGFPEIGEFASRGSTFRIHLQFGDKTLEIWDGKFRSIFSLYRAVSAFRPDLALSADVDKKATNFRAGE